MLDRLDRAFGRPASPRRLPPLDELILTILSQNTSDTNRDRAWHSLRAQFPDWEGVLRAGERPVESAIRIGGLSRIKSRTILGVLRRLRDERGDLDLGFLNRMPMQEGREFLTGFPGVGEKTACCVLLFSCDRPAFPVDTHIHRIARRLGWVPPTATRAVSHAILGAAIPPARCLTAHLNLIALGRGLCRPSRPDCPACPVQSCCRFGRRRRPRPARRQAAGGLPKAPVPRGHPTDRTLY